jgi:hypothetical protein
MFDINNGRIPTTTTGTSQFSNKNSKENMDPNNLHKPANDKENRRYRDFNNENNNSLVISNQKIKKICSDK